MASGSSIISSVRHANIRQVDLSTGRLPIDKAFEDEPNTSIVRRADHTQKYLLIANQMFSGQGWNLTLENELKGKLDLLPIDNSHHAQTP
jgi:hypothetical protein